MPSLKKGGVIFGGQSGRGFASCKTQNGWSAPAPITVGGASFGAQVGFQASDVMAIVTSERAMRALEKGKFTFGADASAAAGPVGKGTGTYNPAAEPEVLTYSRGDRGLFAGATLNGTSVEPDAKATEALYGSSYRLGTILAGNVPRPSQPEARHFRDSLREAFPATPRVAQASP